MGLGLLGAVLLTTTGVAQDASGMLSSGMLGWQEDGVSDIISGTDITGYVDTAFTYNFNNSTGAAENPGRAFDTDQNEFALHGFALDFNRGTNADSMVGYHVTAIFGDDAGVVNSRSAGVFAGQDYSLTNANVSVLLPGGAGPLAGTTMTIGRFESGLGGESIHSNANDNFSRSFLFGLAVPLTHTGVVFERSLMKEGDSDTLTGRIGWVNGWDNVDDNNDSGTALFGADWKASDSVDVDADIVWGAEGAGDTAHQTTLVDVVATLSAPEDLAQSMEILRKMKLQLNAVWGGADADAGDHSQWYGFSTVLRYDFDMPVLGGDGNDIGRFFLAVRGEWMEDPDGARTGAALAANDHAQLYGLTGTLGFKPAKALLIRLEIRYDHASLEGSGGVKAYDDGAREHQTTVGLNVVANL